MKEKNFLEQSEILNNKIEKSFTRAMPVISLQNKIQIARESTQINQPKEPKETKPKKKKRNRNFRMKT